MAYIINRFNGDQISVVNDTSLDQTLPISIIGKNYAGYGEKQNENFVFLLENFSNPTPPIGSITGQLWYNNVNKTLHVYDETLTSWRGIPARNVTDNAVDGKNALTTGDFWWDTTLKQLNVWDGENQNFVLVGPDTTSGALTKIKPVVVKDITLNSYTLLVAYVNDDPVFTISSYGNNFVLDDSTPIVGFKSIYQGITLNGSTTSVDGVSDSFKFWGSAANADLLGGHYTGADFIKVVDPTFENTAKFANTGFTLGLPTAKLTVNYNAGNTTFTTIEGAITKTPLVINGSNITVGGNIASGAVGSNIGALGAGFSTVYADTFSGTAHGATKLANESGVLVPATVSVDALNPGTVLIRTSADQAIQLADGSGGFVDFNLPAGSAFATMFAGTATGALFGDLAEKYLADVEYEPGTVVVVGGDQEVTASKTGDLPIGVVSTNPAFIMNMALPNGTEVALKGRVPTKVTGPVKKGDKLVAHDNGTAIVALSGASRSLVFAIALETNDELGVKLVEAVIL